MRELYFDPNENELEKKQHEDDLEQKQFEIDMLKEGNILQDELINVLNEKINILEDK